MTVVSAMVSCVVEAAVAPEIEPSRVEDKVVPIDTETVVTTMRAVELRQWTLFAGQECVEIDAATRPFLEPGSGPAIHNAHIIVPVQLQHGSACLSPRSWLIVEVI